jgi:DNA-binding transcriptional MerR regulator
MAKLTYFIPDQQYFTIGEASRVTQVPAFTLRYWEGEFSLLRPVRRESGHRRYTRKDIESVFRIKELLYQKRFTLAGAKKVLADEARRTAKPTDGAAAPAGTPDAPLVRELKREVRELLAEIAPPA